MNKPEWMDIVNPHQYSERGIIDCLDDDYNDAHIVYEDGFRAGQKKLLEYQINAVEHDLNFSPLMELFKNWLASMIKQLEEKNG